MLGSSQTNTSTRMMKEKIGQNQKNIPPLFTRKPSNINVLLIVVSTMLYLIILVSFSYCGV